MAYRIAIVDDKAGNRASLAEKIDYSGTVEVVMMACNGADYLNQLKSLPPAMQPQVTLMDIDMPVMDGVEAVRLATACNSNVRYIMLTVFDDEDKLFNAIVAGADGYLLKEEKVESILSAITEVMENHGAPMSPRIARKTLQLLSGRAPAKKQRHPEHCLSVREMEILKAFVNGMDYKDIAESLFLSHHTVRKHIANVYEKLHVTSKTQAVRLAVKNKWI